MRLHALLSFLCLSWSIICFTEGFKIKEKLRRKRQLCEYKSYKHEGIDCCTCPSGYHVQKHCTAATNTTCSLCEDGYYRDSPNDLEICELCTVCLEKANQKIESQCTPFKDTVCSCLDGHYCDKGADCRACYACDKCEDSSVKMPCTATNNTVCHEKSNAGSTAAVVCVVVLAFIAAAAVAALFYIRKKKKFCFSKPLAVTEEELEKLQDVDLTPALSDIAQTLGLRVVKDVVRPLLTDVEMDNVEHNHQKDAEEQTRELLKTWYQKQGSKGAYDELIKKLNKKGHRMKANKVKEIIRELNEQP